MKGDSMEIQSMTGFGCAEGPTFSVEMRSVNHRYLEVCFRMPSFLGRYEVELRRRVKERFAKGRIEISVQVNPEKTSAIRVNRKYAADLMQALRDVQDEFSLDGGISIDLLAGFKDVFVNETVSVDESELMETFCRAMEALAEMRVVEGSHIRDELAARGGNVERYLGIVIGESAGIQKRLRERFLRKFRELLGDASLDEGRMIQEAALLAERADVSEEIARLQSHIRQFHEILNAGGEVGRKLDFLLQEFFREANTIASKASEHSIIATVVDMKGEIEKLREQVQNLQ